MEYYFRSSLREGTKARLIRDVECDNGAIFKKNERKLLLQAGSEVTIKGIDYVSATGNHVHVYTVITDSGDIVYCVPGYILEEKR